LVSGIAGIADLVDRSDPLTLISDIQR
jgi:hypothetical protein